MASILFIRPPQIRWINESKRLSQPLGLLSMMGLLREAGHEVSFCDAVVEGFGYEVEIKPTLYRYGLSDEELGRRISDINPDVVCIASGFTVFWGEVQHVISIAKRVNANAIVIVGGHHASGAFQEVLATGQGKNIDFVILGEGETSILCLVNLLERHRFDKGKISEHGFKTIHGVAYKKGSQVYGSVRPFIQDLDSLPDPAFDLLNPNMYTSEMSHYCTPKGRNFFTYLTQRGCSNGCHFCTTAYHWGNTIRVNSIEKIRRHVGLIQSMGFEEFVFQDDNIALWDTTLRRKYFEAVSESGFYAFNDAGYYYPLMEKYHVEELRMFGIYGVFLPVESPALSTMHQNGKYQEITSKTQRAKKIKKVAEWLNDLGIKFYSAVMIGFPRESVEDLKKAAEFAKFIKKLGAFCVTFNFVHPYPGTPFYKSYYSLVPGNRRWQESPEYYNFIKPVFPFADVSLEDAEKYINEKFEEINGVSDRNPSFSWEP